ncbi:hypothetical protein FNV43_RR26106 [Rhamnella rubrinervis]|uniref:Glucose/Sorbosone dehydrogenase domain-containing protein n=1 Tax=Rhamnella rubrinervis TaxID=2594499 RepID=A0A8K0DI74_9ROSA|nr:hypothetical protein FNV43_RR26106 [Rhamnella rubrinervis]
MNISDSGCSALVKSILCAVCDQFSADLFKVESGSRTVPVLCDSTTLIHSNKSANNFSSTMWNACQNVSILNSPFAPSPQVTTTCFNGEPVSLTSTETLRRPKGLCLEKIGNGPYLNMVAHPDGSNRAFFADQSGKIWLAIVPEQGSGGTLRLNESNPFLDLTSVVYYSNSFGLMGLAFHPNSTQNGRFFAAFNCDKSEDKELEPEIWALGLRNPWRCSFDSQRRLYFICADTGQEQHEEVDIITKGGNYGWNTHEGPFLFNSRQPREGNTSANSTNMIFPVLAFNHTDIYRNERSAAICGGYFYRSMTDQCLYGSDLYADLYGSFIWAASESPKGSGNFSTTEIPFSCTQNSPTNCNSIPGSSRPDLGYIYSFGEDNSKDVFILTSTGVYRVVDPSLCNYTCSKEKVRNISSTSTLSSSNRNQMINTYRHSLLPFLSMLFLLLVFTL